MDDRGRPENNGKHAALHKRDYTMTMFRVSSALDRYVTNVLLAVLLAAVPLSAYLFVSPSL